MPDDYAYVGISPCGCAPAVALDDGSNDLAKDIAEWIEMGRTIERMSVEDARARWTTDCPHDPKWGRHA